MTTQLAQKLRPQAIPGKSRSPTYQDPQDSQLYFAFGISTQVDTATILVQVIGSFTQTLYTNIENGQTFSLDRYFEPLTSPFEATNLFNTDLDDKLNRYGLVY